MANDGVVSAEAPFYPAVLERRGVTVVRPRADEIALIHDRYLNELLRSVFRPETREELLAIARRLRDDDGIDGVILGGTELPLLLRDVKADGLAFLDSTVFHVDAIVTRLLAV